MTDVENFFAEIESRREAARMRAKDEQERIGGRAKAARGDLSQAYVVYALEEEHGLIMSTRALSQIESGLRALKLSEAVALASIYDVELTAFTLDHATASAEGIAHTRIKELERIGEWIEHRVESLREEIGDN